ncbi:MAG: mechanosensitive ion channel [Bacteroidales bacterium]|nr:mechanosensitive ion channel [Bacteroidales bacterium]
MSPLFVFLQTVISQADSTKADAIENATKDAIEYIATTPVSEMLPNLLEKAIAFGLKVVAALLIYIVGGWLIKLIKKLLNKVFQKRSTEKAVASFVSSLVSITLTIILIIITVGALGVNTTSLAALLAAGGMAIGMALSGTVQNFSGGIMIMIFKPFKAGDYITAQGYSGTVAKMSIVSTTITTVDNRSIILPNGSLFSGTIDNYSANEFRRVDLTVGLTYGVRTEDVKAAFQEIVSKDQRILTVATGAPADPFFGLTALADSSVNYVVRVWVKSADYWGVYFDLNEKIYDSLPKKGLSFPFPQLDVHVKQDSDETDQPAVGEVKNKQIS